MEIFFSRLLALAPALERLGDFRRGFCDGVRMRPEGGWDLLSVTTLDALVVRRSPEGKGSPAR